MVSVHTSEPDWIEKVKEYTNDTTLHSMIGKPDIPVLFVEVLHVMLSASQLTPARALHYGVATTLLQMGLEVHDRIPIHFNPAAMSVTSRQLLVLSGDFYSSQYYRLMTQHQELEGLSYLSNIMCSMNESRVKLHAMYLDEKVYSVHAYPDILHFTSGLLAALADFFHVERYLAMDWKAVLSPLLLIQYIEQHSKWFVLLSEPLCHLIKVRWETGKEKLLACPDVKIKEQILAIYAQLEPWVESHLLTKES